MNTRTMGLVLGLLLFVVSACTSPSQEQTSSSGVAITVDSTAPEVSTSLTPATSTEPTSTPSTEPDFCTEEGCDSQLTIELSEVDITPEATYDIEICVDGDCATETITIDVPHPGTGEIIRGESLSFPGPVAGRMLMWAEEDYIEYFLPEGDYGESALVAVTLRDASGSVLAQTEEATEVPLERRQPNGPDCPPVCFFGRLAV